MASKDDVKNLTKTGSPFIWRVMVVMRVIRSRTMMLIRNTRTGTRNRRCLFQIPGGTKLVEVIEKLK